MNFDAGGPSYLSSSSSSDDDNFLSNIITEIDETEEVIREYINNNMILANNLRQQNYQPIHGGLIPGHAVINHDRETAHQNLFIDYFIDNPRFGEDMFRRRYRMLRSLFLRIVDPVKDHDYYFHNEVMDLVECDYHHYRKQQLFFEVLIVCIRNGKIVQRHGLGNTHDVNGSPTIILEAVADYDLWICHAYFGMPETNNNISVLKSSNLFSNLAQGIDPPAHYVIQGKEYNMSYYLANGIYPKWATIVQTIQHPQGSTCFWKKYVLHDIMTACIIMRNMIVDDERDLYAPIQEVREAPTPEVDIILYAPIQEVREAPTPEVDIIADETIRFNQFIARYKQIKDKDAHIIFRNALIDHL
ncbi:uncharacterized protein LOC109827454 [Asparagus officinalis]|uniref:uncharacterized protein LOC109827454 n=1 Tax=Asparagus officinalis TaxID=4686 RepID=UPI00098E376D|nr:uncharacterized protein LOC109827454 [Asparagus officinalis]